VFYALVERLRERGGIASPASTSEFEDNVSPQAGAAE
jgi:hypothetical protein